MTERHRLVPLRTRPVGQALQLERGLLEVLRILAIGIDLEQLRVHRDAARVLAERFLEDFLGLPVTAVGHVDVGLGNRIDFVAFPAADADAADGSLGSVDRGRSGRRRRGRSSRRVVEHRRSACTGGGAEHAVLELGALRLLLAPPGPGTVAAEQQHDAAQAGQRNRIFDEFLDEALVSGAAFTGAAALAAFFASLAASFGSSLGASLASSFAASFGAHPWALPWRLP